jgi:hypothetical protein
MSANEYTNAMTTRKPNILIVEDEDQSSPVMNYS